MGECDGKRDNGVWSGDDSATVTLSATDHILVYDRLEVTKVTDVRRQGGFGSVERWTGSVELTRGKLFFETAAFGLERD